MISYENTKTVQDLVWNTGREYAGRVFLRYEENDVVYEVTYGEFADQCHAVAAWLREQDAAAGHKVRVGLIGKQQPPLSGISVRCNGQRKCSSSSGCTVE